MVRYLLKRIIGLIIVLFIVSVLEKENRVPLFVKQEQV